MKKNWKSYIAFILIFTGAPLLLYFYVAMRGPHNTRKPVAVSPSSGIPEVETLPPEPAENEKVKTQPPSWGFQEKPDPPPDYGKMVITANVIEVEKERIKAVSPEGVCYFKIKPGASLPPGIKKGDTLAMKCITQPGGTRVVEQASHHIGLPIWFGNVVEMSPLAMTVENPLGRKKFYINEYSDIPKDVITGTFTGVKYYNLGQKFIILNCRRYPGCMQEAGVIKQTGGDYFIIRTLKGDKLFRMPSKNLGQIKTGDPVIFNYRIDEKDRLNVISLHKKSEDFIFTGKINHLYPKSGTIVLVDAGGALLGDVEFNLKENFAIISSLKPGDLVQVKYIYTPDGKPTIVSIKKKKLTPVYFGEILEKTSTRIKLVTRQNQVKELQITRNTIIPKLINKGDFADVIYRETPGESLPEALIVVKE